MMNTVKNNNIVNSLKQCGGNMSKNCVTNLRCHLCCKNFSSEDFEYHLREYHRANSKEPITLNQPNDSVTNFVSNNINNNIRRSNNNTLEKCMNRTMSGDSRYDRFNYNVSRLSNENVNKRTGHDRRLRSHTKNCIRAAAILALNNNNKDTILNRRPINGKPWSNPNDHIKAVLEFKLDVHRFYCGFCKKSCVNPIHYELNQWSRVDTHKPFVCNICFQNFQKKSQLKKHEIKHSTN